jgi:hypothetical protein
VNRGAVRGGRKSGGAGIVEIFGLYPCVHRLGWSGLTPPALFSGGS